ncbi:MAG: phage head-tail adapter protein [Alphaproteobacteria bacterium]|nr:phage head-tail adapter protein [Alphaproteobacteria bacterium]
MVYPTSPAEGKSERSKLLNLLAAMKNERSSWDPHWMEIEKFLFPRGGRFQSSDRNRGEKKHNNIYDNTGTRALSILAAGLMSGATNPSRPWFRLVVPDPDLMKSEAVKIWCNKVTQLLLDIFARSNTYRALHSLYEELAAFGTGCSIVTDDFDAVIHNNVLTIGEYSYAADYRNVIDTAAREFEYTVAQMVGRFGYENCSQAVQQLYNTGRMTAWVPVVHVIRPRTERDRKAKDAKNMPFQSCYFEPGRDNGDEKFLRESGFKHFRVLAPRWTVKSNDIYGHSAGMEALGDIKSLQHEQVRKAEGIDYKTKPPLQVPTKLKGRALDRLPGGVSYYDATGPGAGVRTMFDVNIDLQHLLLDIQDVRERINKAFYTDVFFAISQFDPGKMTATEVSARNQEGLLQLGPVLERLHNELLGPLIDMTFVRVVEARGPDGKSILPQPPEELQGMELKIEYSSILAQAQRSINTNATDRWVFSLGEVAKVKPTVLDKFDEDKWAEIHADDLGVNPELIVADEQVAIIRKARADQQAAMAEAAMINQGADTAAKLSKADTGNKNALTDITRAVGA